MQIDSTPKPSASNKVKYNYMWGEVVCDNKMLVPDPDWESHIHKKLHKTANKQHDQNRNISRGTGLLAVSRQKSHDGAGQSWRKTGRTNRAPGRLLQVSGEESELGQQQATNHMVGARELN